MNFEDFYLSKPKGAFNLKHNEANGRCPLNIVITQEEYKKIRPNAIPRMVVIPFGEYPTKVDRDLAMYLTKKYKGIINAVGAGDKIITIEDDLDELNYHQLMKLLRAHNEQAKIKDIEPKPYQGKIDEIRENIRDLRRSGIELTMEDLNIGANEE